jgi:hypothetical protein
MKDALQDIQKLYDGLWRYLCKQDAELDEDFGIARNLACSEWTETLMGLAPTKILPDRTELLRENFERLQDQISLQKYYLTCAFKSLLGDKLVYQEGARANWEYWESVRIEEIQKEQS